MLGNEKYKDFTVNYLLDEREQKALEELLPYFQNCVTKDGKKIFEKWTVENVFDSIMTQGCHAYIAQRIQYTQLMQGLIEYEDFVKDGFKTMEEIKNHERKESAINKLNTYKSESKQDKNVTLDFEKLLKQNEVAR